MLLLPLYNFSDWQSTYGGEFTFYETSLSMNKSCSVDGGILILSSQITTFFSLMFALEKYFTIGRVKRFLARRTVCVIYASIWIIWTSGSFALKLHRHLIGATNKITDCLFGPINSAFRIFLGICFASNMIIVTAVAVLYSFILKTIWQSYKGLDVGRKHGRDTFGSTFTRLVVIIVVSLLSMVLPSVIMINLSFGTSVQHTHLIAIIYPFVLSLCGSPLTLIMVKRRHARRLKRNLCTHKGCGSC